MTIVWCTTHLASGSTLQTQCYYALGWTDDEPVCVLEEKELQ